MNNIAERYRLAHLMKQQEAGVKKKLRWNTPAEVRRSLAASIIGSSMEK